MNSTTPKNVNKFVKELCSKINPNGTPRNIDVVPDSDSIQDECVNNVLNKIRKDGGDIVYGWQIWEAPGIYTEAEFHAIWKSPTGDFIDISKRQEKRILFLPNPNYIDDGKRIDNVRISESKNPIVDEFIQTCKEIFQIVEKHIDYSTGNVKFPPSVYMAYMELEMKKADLLKKMNNLSPDPNGPCFCGSGKIFKECCEN